MIENSRKLGALHLGDGQTLFRVWAPDYERVSVTFPGTSRIESQMVKGSLNLRDVFALFPVAVLESQA